VNSASSSKIATDLQSASALLQTGQHEAARDLLRNILSVQPELTEAHWLLAVSLFETGDLSLAQRELQTVLQREPRCVPALATMGHILLSSLQIESAVRTFRNVLYLNPDPVQAASFARALLMQDRPDEAISVLAPVLQKGKVTPEVLLLHGHALMTLGRSDEAVLAFQELVRLSPQDGEAKVRLGAALSDSGRHVEAETCVREGIAQGVHTPEAHFVLGRALMGQSRLQEAEPELRRVVRHRPEHLTAQANLSELIWMRSGDATTACLEIDKALQSHPQLLQLRITKANLLVAAGEHKRALVYVEEGIDDKAAPHELLRLHVAASQIAIELDAQRALEHARRALELNSGHRLALSAYGDALLATGNAAQAIQIAIKLLQSSRHDGRAVALLASASRMAGDERYRELFDYEKLVLAQYIDVPPGWATLAEYLSDLSEALQQLHSSNIHPVGQSLRQGSQIELDLERAPEPAIRAFTQAIEAPIRRFMMNLGPGNDPLRGRNTGGHRIKGAWSVRLRSSGFHVNHHHPEGWISSACYIQLPDAVSKESREGWLKFGEPGFPTNPALPAEYFVRPEPGLLVLFPSYMWHGTAPFSSQSNETRLTIAFDLLPSK
jgi:Flp pilus assembly protein TadD